METYQAVVMEKIKTSYKNKRQGLPVLPKTLVEFGALSSAAGWEEKRLTFPVTFLFQFLFHHPG